MHITDIIRGDSPTFSFEFFPPRTVEAAEILYQTIRDLESYMPHFVSVTYGAGGSTRDLTHDLVERIQRTTKLDPIPHLTCVCHNEEEIERILLRYARSAIGNILALGGDRPHEIAFEKSRDSFQHAIDLVKFIRRFNESGVHPDPRGFGIGVAGFPEGHPATSNRLLEMDYLKAKVEAGADYIVTQLFFENRDFLDFRERCALANIHVRSTMRTPPRANGLPSSLKTGAFSEVGTADTLRTPVSASILAVCSPRRGAQGPVRHGRPGATHFAPTWVSVLPTSG